MELSWFSTRLIFLTILLGTALLTEAAQVGDGCSRDGCSRDGDCGQGLHCDSCGSICTRVKPTDPETVDKGLPFNHYSWLTTHNSFALAGSKSATGSDLITPTNQQDTVTSQLQNGVRGLMLDMYDFLDDIWLCHSFGGNCYNFTAFQPAINVLKEIRAFLASNPSAVVTIFIEDYVTSPGGLTKVFNASGLSEYWLPASEMPKNGSDWPLLGDMIGRNQRLLVFTSKEKEASEGIGFEWNYVVENQYGEGGMKAGSCPNRAESSPMTASSKSLVLMNYFPDNPNSTAACADNSAPLVAMLTNCHALSRNRWPNFIAVDFYKESNGGGAAEATDIANGHMVCGCDNIAYCVKNASFGTCRAAPPRSATKVPSSNQFPQQEGSDASCLLTALFSPYNLVTHLYIILLICTVYLHY